MKVTALFLFLSLSFASYSQTIIEASVIDSKTKEPLIFCNVSVKNTPKGTITNSDGIFKLSLNLEKDSVIISYLGYDRLTVTAKDLYKNKIIKLEKKNFVLNEVIVQANINHLYRILNNCRRNLISNNDKISSKVYYGVESKTNGKSMELVECYYNADLKGIKIKDLNLKNGRIGITPINDLYFFTLHTSKVIEKLDFIKENDEFPYNPLQLTKNMMKMCYNLFVISVDEEYYHIGFSPKNNNRKFFYGEIWIDKKNYNLLKINLKADNASLQPFITLFSSDKITDVNFDITTNYKLVDGKTYPDHMNFNYSFNYHAINDSLKKISDNVKIHNILSESIMYFYDFKDPFIIPYFEYFNKDVNDYVKLSIIPYNKVFWENNNAFLLSNTQKENLNFFAKEGYTYNYHEGDLGKDFFTSITEYDSVSPILNKGYVFWSKDKYLDYEKDLRSDRSKNGEDFLLKSQILFDILKLEDSIYWTSYTVFDSRQSFYNIFATSNTNAFINIYFDICEIERLKMEDKLRKEKLNVEEINQIYQETLVNIDRTTKRYFKDAKFGNNLAIQVWNDYVYERLGKRYLLELENKPKE